MNSITVFCGSSTGNEAQFKEQAYQLGKTLAIHNIGLIYGGAGIGLMGAVANGTLEHGGTVTGVLPRFLQNKEIAHAGLTELILVDTMHERKQKMNELSDGVIALPGGYGTLEELFEMLTWAQLSLHEKPIGILNIDGFYDELVAMIDKMVQKGFLRQEYKEMIIVSTDIEQLIHAMQHYQVPAEKWAMLKKV